MKLRERVSLLERQLSLNNRLDAIESRLTTLEQSQRAVINFVGGELFLHQPVVIRKKEAKKGEKS